LNTETALLERWLWVIASLGIAMLASAIRWIVVERPRLSAAAPQKSPSPTLFDQPWFVHPLRLLYAVGIPALAYLWRGVLTPSGLGLQQFFWSDGQTLDMAPGSWDNWVRDIGWVCALACGFWAIIRLADHLTHTTGVQHRPGIALREAIYHQVHWAFYREPFVLTLGIGLGTWAGLLPVVIEALVNPARWTDLQFPDRGRDLLVRVGLGVLSAMLFLQTQNLWLAILADAGLVWALGQTTRTT